MLIQALAVIGFLLSSYALYVGERKRKDKKYKPFCDISEHVSCTKTLASKYSHFLILPNAAYGLIFYVLVFITAGIYGPYLVTLAAIGSFATIILAFFSYYKLRNLCIICTASYLVNITIAILAFKDAFVG